MNRTESATRFRVCVSEADSEASPSYRFAAAVSGPDRIAHVAFAPTREQAWSLALATLRGMIALERLRKLA